MSKKIVSEKENNSIWIKTPLSEFGFKCVMNKHDICVDFSCGCLCHHGTFDLSLEKQKSSLEINENVIWLNS